MSAIGGDIRVGVSQVRERRRGGEGEEEGSCHGGPNYDSYFREASKERDFANSIGFRPFRPDFVGFPFFADFQVYFLMIKNEHVAA